MRVHRRLFAVVVVAATLLPLQHVHAVDGNYFACIGGSGYLSTPNTDIAVTQGQTVTIPIAIHRVGCTGELNLYLWFGSVAGTTVTLSPNPATGDSVTMTVKTTTATALGGLPLSLSVQGAYPDIYLPLGLTVQPSIAPIETAPRSGFAVGAVIGSSTTPVRTTWSATDPDGVARYAVQRSVDGGAWSAVRLSSGTARAISQSLSFGHRYQYRVRATDKLGHTSSWVTGRAFVPRIHQQSTSAFSSDWHWTTVRKASASHGSLKYQPYSGATFRYTFTASSVAWVGVAGPNRVNNFNVFIDGNPVAYNRSLNRSRTQYRRIAYAANWASDVKHVYEIQDLGRVGHSRIDVDAFVVLDQV